MTMADVQKFAVSLVIMLLIHLAFKRKKSGKLNSIHLKKMADGGSASGVKDVDFLFYFPTEKDAENASKSLREWDFKPVIRPYNGQFVIEFTQTMTFSLEMMDSISEKFHELARKNNGEFDGWGCEA